MSQPQIRRSKVANWSRSLGNEVEVAQKCIFSPWKLDFKEPYKQLFNRGLLQKTIGSAIDELCKVTPQKSNHLTWTCQWKEGLPNLECYGRTQIALEHAFVKTTRTFSFAQSSWDVQLNMNLKIGDLARRPTSGTGFPLNDAEASKGPFQACHPRSFGGPGFLSSSCSIATLASCTPDVGVSTWPTPLCRYHIG